MKILRCSFLSSASTGEFVLLIRRCVFSVRGLWAEPPVGHCDWSCLLWWCNGEYSNFLIGACQHSTIVYCCWLANVNYCPTDKKKISFNSPPTPNRTRTTITEYHLEHSTRVTDWLGQAHGAASSSSCLLGHVIQILSRWVFLLEFWAYKFKSSNHEDIIGLTMVIPWAEETSTE